MVKLGSKANPMKVSTPTEIPEPVLTQSMQRHFKLSNDHRVLLWIPSKSTSAAHFGKLAWLCDVLHKTALDFMQ